MEDPHLAAPKKRFVGGKQRLAREKEFPSHLSQGGRGKSEPGAAKSHRRAGMMPGPGGKRGWKWGFKDRCTGMDTERWDQGDTSSPGPGSRRSPGNG